MHKGAFISFELLQNKYGLGQDDFYRYLQVRHYFDQNIKITLDKCKLGFLQTFLTLITSFSLNNFPSYTKPFSKAKNLTQSTLRGDGNWKVTYKFQMKVG